jgi:hypothetical protein
MSQPDLLAAALAHATRGWHVFPLWPGSKIPAVPDSWQHRATRDPDLIRRWWAGRPFNIGLATGPSGLLVIDLDTPKPATARCAATSATSVTSQVNPVADPAHVADTSATRPAGRHGRNVFTALCASHGRPVPADTFIVATPSGGWHLYYQAPHGPPLRNTKGGTARALGDAIDTRGHGGYVVAPGSVIGPRIYTVVRDRPAAPVPGWLTDLLRELDRAALSPAPTRPVAVPLTVTDRRSAYLRAALDREAGHVCAAPAGRRNAALWGAAAALGQLVAGGDLAADTVTGVLEQAAISAGLAGNEARATIRSGLRRGAQRPRTVA